VRGRSRRAKSIPDEDPLASARREFEEELGSPVSGEFTPLAPIRQASGKLVYAWAVRIGSISGDPVDGIVVM
jgi:predicted NUDIX family NTP pyrophosphohydrolase